MCYHIVIPRLFGEIARLIDVTEAEFHIAGGRSWAGIGGGWRRFEWAGLLRDHQRAINDGQLGSGINEARQRARFNDTSAALTSSSSTAALAGRRSRSGRSRESRRLKRNATVVGRQQTLCVVLAATGQGHFIAQTGRVSALTLTAARADRTGAAQGGQRRSERFRRWGQSILLRRRVAHERTGAGQTRRTRRGRRQMIQRRFRGGPTAGSTFGVAGKSTQSAG